MQDAPPLTRNMPPVAGSVKWSRSLFARVKQTMQKLQDVEAELLQGETGQEVQRQHQPQHAFIFLPAVMYTTKVPNGCSANQALS